MEGNLNSSVLQHRAKQKKELHKWLGIKNQLAFLNIKKRGYVGEKMWRRAQHQSWNQGASHSSGACERRTPWQKEDLVQASKSERTADPDAGLMQRWQEDWQPEQKEFRFVLLRRLCANPAGTELGQKKKIEKVGTPFPKSPLPDHFEIEVLTWRICSSAFVPTCPWSKQEKQKSKATPKGSGAQKKQREVTPL